MERQKTYHGKPCHKCGGTLRYRVDRHCVACDAKRPRRGNLTAKARADAHRFVTWRNTFLTIFYPEQFDRDGVRRVERAGGE